MQTKIYLGIIRNKCVYPLILTILLFSFIGNTQNLERRILPPIFGDKAFSHIRNLEAFGLRQAGTANEMEAANYIQQEFLDMGLTSEIEMFEYESFEFQSLDLEINNCHYTPVGLGFTPYKNKRMYQGKAVFVDSREPENYYIKDSIVGKTIISNDIASHFQLLQYQPELIIYVDPLDFTKLKNNSETTYYLKIEGSYHKLKSPNVLAQIGNGSVNKKEIIIGAHLDSYRNSPGASDNGSGIGVMLELARYLKKHESQLNGVVKFIAFGAEELGVLGSRKYVAMHRESLKKCVLFFNIDDVGGNGIGSIETKGGITSLPEPLLDELSKKLVQEPWEGAISYWRVLPEACLMNFITTVNHPTWLVDVVESSVKESGLEINYATNMGADQMSFSAVGVASSAIGIAGAHPHTPFDSIEKVNKQSLTKAGELTVRIVLKTDSLLKK
ncbi:MAG: hypothetical protein A2X13_11465 [Bacteroidetes bacterium GWC2_33_15]|nr:MAG: hypothetical protein A2X10_05490 [Bacteroidetes bacterium GWA2_33_15]OFX50759.1 MAG: hypothetical protein A2X13_11465 [Bacteroidetes bacterium GWC2_33_15]OFX62959.1 MAG: hypothetical protein A2X15_09905 [Bacteroidetes bacterium GWB2_32_14]OFX70028.1 MAG: hypothetical protein A2X14_02765 [Bacteroidetes bacterium GWD2_33_33]HAN19028.1 hypothetical protein [Bacteroidales bacterium]